MHTVSRSVLTMLLGLACCTVPFACGDDEGDGETASAGDDDSDDDTPSGDDSDEDDDAPANDDDAPEDDDAPATDDDSDDDAADDDDQGGTTTFETDAGTVQVVFGGEGEECGSETCLDGTLTQEGAEVLPPLSGCCVDEATETCGLDLTAIGTFIGLDNPSCEALNLPGSPDPNCEDSPPLEAVLDSANGIVLPGCCQASGQCGYNASIQGLGFGCLSPTRFGGDEGGDCEYQP